MKGWQQHTAMFSLLCVTAAWAGCIERNLNPFEENAGIYSIYGALDLDEETHAIRINNVQTPVLSDEQTKLDVSVTFLDVATDHVTTLRDSIINHSGFITHNFILEEKLDPKKLYRLAIQDSSGPDVSVSVSTPGITEVSINPVENVPCHAEPDSIPHEIPIEFSFKNVEPPEHIQMEVGFHVQNGIRWEKIGKVAQLEFRENQHEMFVIMTPRHLLVEVFPPEEILDPDMDPRDLIPMVTCENLVSDVVRIRYIHYGSEWDRFRPGFFPVNPMEWLEIENSLGFLGAFRQDSLTFTLDLPDI